MYCEECGEKITNESSFCEHCGAAINIGADVNVPPPNDPNAHIEYVGFNKPDNGKTKIGNYRIRNIILGIILVIIILAINHCTNIEGQKNNQKQSSPINTEQVIENKEE